MMRVYHEIRKNEDGFTMIEMMVVIIIIGIVIGTFTSGFVVYLDQTRTKSSAAKLEKITEAVNIYLDINGKLPCVASLSTEVDGADFGREINSGNCNAGGTPAGTGLDSSFNVRIGAVPVRNLNIPDEYMFDGWGNRFVYAVQQRLATAGQYNSVGQIAVVDSADNLITNSAHFAVVSVGEDGVGGYNRGGVLTAACNNAHLDGENCDMDARFRATILTSSADGSTHFDDIIYYQGQTESGGGGSVPSGAVMAFDANSCPSGWSAYAAARGRYMIGAGIYPTETYDYQGRNWSSARIDGSLRQYFPGDTGGYANWMQSGAELAQHRHTSPIRSRSGYGDGGFFGSRDAADTDSAGTLPTTIVPANPAVPMENIPPYVALLYCRKD